MLAKSDSLRSHTWLAVLGLRPRTGLAVSLRSPLPALALAFRQAYSCAFSWARLSFGGASRSYLASAPHYFGVAFRPWGRRPTLDFARSGRLAGGIGLSRPTFPQYPCGTPLAASPCRGSAPRAIGPAPLMF